MKSARLTAVTANIGRGVPPREAAQNIRAVINGYKPTTWRRNPASYGWQEIDEADVPDEHGILHRTVRALTPGSTIVGFQTACPIVVPPGWRVVREKVTKTCDGRPKVTPHRVCVQALIEDQKTGIRIVRMNGHYPFNAWDLWRDCNDRWMELVDAWNLAGYTVVATRDRNKRGNTEPLSPWEVPLLPAVSIDKISVIQAPPGTRSVRVIAGKPRTVNLTVDGHNAHGVPLTFTPMGKR